MIHKLNENDIGRYVIYKDFDKDIVGRIKSYNNKNEIAFVVYSCNNKWNEYYNYTAQSTKYEDLDILKDKIQICNII